MASYSGSPGSGLNAGVMTDTVMIHDTREERQQGHEMCTNGHEVKVAKYGS